MRILSEFSLFFFLLSFLLTPSRVFSISSETPSKKIAQASSSTSSSKTSSSSKGGKTQAFMGDPALKRGFELGYDSGMKAGKADKIEGRKENPSSHPDYKSADKRHRSEYGNQGKFVSGFQAGFAKGYKAGYSQGKLDPEAAKKAKEKDKIEPRTSAPKLMSETAPQKKAVSPTAPKAKKFNPADDAL